ncbi:hypothetical protein HORIV_70670 [Vreelandella olivaria]|uniref:Uncharacterized protein n=1 Tax=Vreelandella olivaria TaxID=390919 RepID=A0ABN5XDP2_9GAMM|nr:hypothetical protein HORIV_70670 [Halomonas olivaria]
MLIVIALQAELAIRDLFLASIVPGLILVLLFIATIGLLCRRRPDMGPAGVRSSWSVRWRSLKGIIEIGALFTLVLGGYLRAGSPQQKRLRWAALAQC